MNNKRGRPKKEDAKTTQVRCRLTQSEKEELDNCRARFNVTVGDVLKFGMSYLKILDETSGRVLRNDTERQS